MSHSVKKSGKYRFKFWYYRHTKDKKESRQMVVSFFNKEQLVDKIQCWVPCESKYQTYPQCIMQGWASALHIQKIKNELVAILI